MPQYKFTVFYQGHGFGASESWYTSNSSIAGAASTISTYCFLRNAMLFTDCEIQGVRVGRTSLTAAPSNGLDGLRQSQLYLPGTPLFEGGPSVLKIPQPGTYTPQDLSRKEAFANVAVNERLTFSDNRSTTRYIAWPPAADVGIDLAGGSLLVEPAWFALLGRLQDFIANAPTAVDGGGPLYIKAATGSSPGNTFPIRGWVLQVAAPGLIGYVVDSINNANMVPGALVHIRGVRRRSAPQLGGPIKLQSINGRWYVDSAVLNSPSTGLTTVYLRGTAGVDPTTIKLLGNVQLQTYQLYPVQLARSVRIRTHKRGKPSLVPRGRRLTRTSADP